MLLKSPFKAFECPFSVFERTFNDFERTFNVFERRLILLNIEKQIGAATFSVEHLCL